VIRILLALRTKLVTKIATAVKNKDPDDLQLAFPIIYDPEKTTHIQYRGFRSNLCFPDLDIADYLAALEDRSKETFEDQALEDHKIYEVDEEGHDSGEKWSLLNCLATELEHEGQRYVLSGGRWYKIATELAEDVSNFFNDAPKATLPPALSNENEETYNKRQKAENKDLLCLDRELVRPSTSASSIEVCDFLSKDGQLIHVKDKTSSSRLSHLFSQGTVRDASLF
jgi:uncharacterized protein (TIGR04141 family)